MPLRIDVRIGMEQSRADAINFAAQQAAGHPDRRFVVNISWRTNGDHAGVRTAIQNATMQGMIVVAAAGNEGLNTGVVPQYPGQYPEVIAVAALDKLDRMASFTNFGPNIDVCAPGVEIWSALRSNNYGFLSGTSMAAPFVTGLAALIWSFDLDLTSQQVRQHIESNCDSLDAIHPGFVGQLGRGRVNADRACGSIPVRVPDVLGLGRTEAANLVRAAHLTPQLIAGLGPGRHEVVDQSPGPGALALPRAVVSMIAEKA